VLINKPTSQTSLQKGVTLLEMMIALAILAIVLTVVAPNIREFLIKNRITGELNEISGIVQYARHVAIDQQSPVILCPANDYKECGNDWDDPKIVFIDENGDGDRDDDEDLLVASSPTSDTTYMDGPNNQVEFQETGASNRSFNIILCPSSKDVKYARAINISLQGRVRVSKDSDNDGVHEDTSGDALTCP
jgi:type IV fimbrial biogenesis protein FimT